MRVNIRLANNTRSWFSVALVDGTRIELRKMESHTIYNEDKTIAEYYKQFVPLGLSVIIEDVEEKEIIEEVNAEEMPFKQEEIVKEIEPVVVNVDEGFEVLEPNQDHYEDMTIAQLKKLCDSLGIEYKVREKKDDLIAKLVN